MLNAHLMGLGGSQYLVLEIAIAFAERGYDVYVDSLAIKSRGDLVKIANFFGVNKSEVMSISVGDPPNRPLVTINASGDVISGVGDVMYVHYPSFIDLGVYYPGLKGIPRLVGELYSLFNMIISPVIKKRVKLFIANSRFTADFLRKALSVKSIVVHPPVNLDDIVEKPVLDYTDRDKRVLTVARISPEKHPERAVYLAYLLKKYKISTLLVGALSRINKPLYDKLVEVARKLNVDDYFDIEVNVSRHKLVELYRGSLIYVHITPREHFGISIVEAMAAGTPVIIPRDSGSWTDIALGDDQVAASYLDLREAQYKVLALQSNPDLWRQMSIKGRQRAIQLDKRNFRRNIFEAIKPLINERDEEKPRL
jgi:glycosyltransferase involved in cell wall biosynthesis